MSTYSDSEFLPSGSMMSYDHSSTRTSDLGSMKVLIADGMRGWLAKELSCIASHADKDLISSVVSKIIEEFKVQACVEFMNTSIVNRVCQLLCEGLGYAIYTRDISVLVNTFLYILVTCLGTASLPVVFIVSLAASLMRCVPDQRDSRLRTEAFDSEGIASFLTAIWQAISLAKGATIEKPACFKDWCNAVFEGIGKTSNKTRSLLTMFENLAKVVTKMLTFILDHCFGIKTGVRLLYHDNDLMRAWTEECNLLLRPDTEELILNEGTWFARLVVAHRLSYKFATEINVAGAKDLPPLFLELQRRLSALHQRAVNMGIATAYRPEPICIWVSGSPGIGKTYMKDDLISVLLNAAQIRRTGNDVYTLGVGTKHWTGCENKTVIYYDDFATVDSDDLSAEQIGHFMHLVSDARFAPPQADVPDKGKAINPKLVYVNCNESHPKFNCLRNPEAFCRRRHMCIDVKFSPEFLEAFNSVPLKELTLEYPGAKQWVTDHTKPGNKYPQMVMRFINPMNGSPLNDWANYEKHESRIFNEFIHRFYVNDQAYRNKMSRSFAASTVKTSSPLADILTMIKDEALDLSGIDTCKEDTRPIVSRRLADIYSYTTDTLREGSQLCSQWFKDIIGLVSTEGGCTCFPGLISRYEYDPVSRKIWRNDWEENEPVLLEFCSEDCQMKSRSWWSKARNLSTSDRWYVVDGLYSHMFKTPTVHAESPEFSFEKMTDAFTQTREEVPKRSWPRKYVVAVAALSAVGLFFVGDKLFTWIFKAKPEDISDGMSVEQWCEHIASKKKEITEVIASGDNTTVKTRPQFKGISRKIVKTNTELFVEGTTQNMANIVDRALCYLVLSGVDRASGAKINGLAMRCFGICGRWLICLKHYIAKVKRTDDAKVNFVNSNGTVVQPLDFDSCKVRGFDESEIVLIEMPLTIPAFRDIRRHIMSESDSKSMSTQATIYEKALGFSARLYEVSLKMMNNVIYEDDGVTYSIPCAFSYKWHAPGRCMSPIIANCGIGQRIVAFHFAGGNDRGTGEPVLSESFYDAIPSVLSAQAPDESFLDNERESRICLSGDLEPEGIVKGKFSAHIAERTSIVPSLIHGYLPIKTKPAPLQPADVNMRFSPLIEGVVFHGQPCVNFDRNLLEKAVQDVHDQYMSVCKPIRPVIGVLSIQDSILGLPGLDGYQAMEMNTSEGFPYTTTRPSDARNKSYLFDIREDGCRRELLGVDPNVMSRMNDNEIARSSGIIPFTVFTDCLKDSRIPVESYYKPGKTRIFSVSPVDFTIQFRQYFLDIMASQKICRHDMEHMVGMDVHSIEWSWLAQTLQQKGPKLICGDYSKFGPRLNSEVVYEVGKIWRQWYLELERRDPNLSEQEIQRRYKVREVMFEEIRHSAHLCKDILYKVLCGAPSGCPPTVNINNDVNKIYIRMAWLDCWKDFPIMATLVAFKKHCNLFVYGDDLIINVSDEAAERFNNEFLQQFFARHDIKYTDELKGDSIRKYCLLHEASFLKGRFIQSQTRTSVIGYGLAKDSIEDCANWIHKNPDKAYATSEAIYQSLMLSYEWGREYFNLHRDRLLKAWAENVGTPISLYTYDDMDSIRFGFFDPNVALTLDQLVQKEREYRELQKRELDSSAGLIPIMSAESQITDPEERIRYKSVYKRLFNVYRLICEFRKSDIREMRQYHSLNRTIFKEFGEILTPDGQYKKVDSLPLIPEGCEDLSYLFKSIYIQEYI